MAVKLYTGIMGSGKTYEVVSEVILNSLRKGRRVVSNIAGLNYEAMREILVAEGVPENSIGQLVHVKHEEVLEPLFWKTDKDEEQGINSFIQLGDVVCLDEIWRFWSGFARKDEEGNKRPDRVMNFFRMHRQMPHPETGLTCEIALITQDVPDLSRQVRGVLEEIYVMTKLTALGLTSRYRVDIYSRKISRKPVRSIPRSYNPKYFGLYASHSQKKDGAVDAVEQNIDGRGNLLKSGFFKFGIPLALVVFVGAGFYLWKFFHPVPPVKQVEEQGSAVQVANAQPAAAVSHSKPIESDTWRVVGYSQSGAAVSFVIQNSAGHIRHLVNAPVFKISALSSEVQLPEGGFATSWAGVQKERAGVFP